MQHRSFTLECTPGDYQERARQTASLRVASASARDAARCKRLWSGVGAGFWTERSRWSAARWRERLELPNVTFWIALASGEDTGCFELTRLARGIKLEGFGLLPPYRGQGLGCDLLSQATEIAFATGAPKIWLHTATDDHPHALPNYIASGYRIVRERDLRKPVGTMVGQ